jgi:hypothetical protein
MPLSGNNKYINIESKAPEIFRRFFYGLIPISTAIDIKLFWAFPANWRVRLSLLASRKNGRAQTDRSILNAHQINNEFNTRGIVF